MDPAVGVCGLGVSVGEEEECGEENDDLHIGDGLGGARAILWNTVIVFGYK